MNMHRSDDPQAGSARLNVSLRSAGLKAARGRLGGLRQSPWTSTRMPRLNPYLRLELESTIRIQADPGGPQRTTYRAAVNRKVLGSSPSSGATLLNTKPDVCRLALSRPYSNRYSNLRSVRSSSPGIRSAYGPTDQLTGAKVWVVPHPTPTRVMGARPNSAAVTKTTWPPRHAAISWKLSCCASWPPGLARSPPPLRSSLFPPSPTGQEPARASSSRSSLYAS